MSLSDEMVSVAQLINTQPTTTNAAMSLPDLIAAYRPKRAALKTSFWKTEEAGRVQLVQISVAIPTLSIWQAPLMTARIGLSATRTESEVAWARRSEMPCS